MRKNVLLLFALFFSSPSADAQLTPKLLPFQGRLTDQNGVAVIDGARLIQFKIFDIPTGGAPVWAGELHRTTVNGGLVNVLLGSKTSFTGVDFDRTLYLEITVDTSGPNGVPDNAITAADPPMLPRQAILPVLFAKEAANSRLLDGYDWTDVFAEGATNPSAAKFSGARIVTQTITAAQLANSSVTSNHIAPGAVTRSGIAAGAIGNAQIADGAVGLQQISQSAMNVLVPPGSITAYAGDSIPTGWLLCDGAAISRTTYSNLWLAIGRVWGVGDGSTTFNLPDLRGYFLRGWDQNAGRDPDKASRIRSAVDGNAGNQVGSIEDDNLRSHSHEVFPRLSGYTPGIGNYIQGAVSQNAQSPPYGSSVTGASGGAETRPKNAYVMYVIKY